jgi:dienelactone hydrolase
MAAGRLKALCVLAAVVLAGAFLHHRIRDFITATACGVAASGRRVSTEDVHFPSGTLRIAGTLYAPFPLTGRRPAVVISHGGTRRGRRLALYTVAARKLAERGYVVLVIDFRGFGDSERPRRFETASDLDFVQDVVAAVDYLASNGNVDPGRISAVGHSFGAGVAVAAALRDRRIGRAVSISPGRNTAKRFFGPGAPDPAYPSRRMSRDMGVDPPIPRALFDPHLKAYVAEAILDHPVHPPVLLVDGANEAPDDLAFLADVAARMTAPKGYVTIPGADHYFGTRQDQDGSAPTTPYDARVMAALVDALDAWLKKPDARFSPS